MEEFKDLGQRLWSAPLPPEVVRASTLTTYLALPDADETGVAYGAWYLVHTRRRHEFNGNDGQLAEHCRSGSQRGRASRSSATDGERRASS